MVGHSAAVGFHFGVKGFHAAVDFVSYGREVGFVARQDCGMHTSHIGFTLFFLLAEWYPYLCIGCGSHCGHIFDHCSHSVGVVVVDVEPAPNGIGGSE